MMNLIARAPLHVSSSTSVSLGKRSYGSQDPWSSIAKKEERSGQPDIGIYRLKASDRYYHEQFMESFSTMSNLSKASLQQATKITETLTESMVSQWNSSGPFSQDSIRCSSVKKSKV